MAFLDDATWEGKIYSSGWKRGEGGEAPVTEPAITDTRWVTLRGDIASYPF